MCIHSVLLFPLLLWASVFRSCLTPPLPSSFACPSVRPWNSSVVFPFYSSSISILFPLYPPCLLCTCAPFVLFSSNHLSLASLCPPNCSYRAVCLMSTHFQFFLVWSLLIKFLETSALPLPGGPPIFLSGPRLQIIHPKHVSLSCKP